MQGLKKGDFVARENGTPNADWVCERQGQRFKLPREEKKKTQKEKVTDPSWATESQVFDEEAEEESGKSSSQAAPQKRDASKVRRRGHGLQSTHGDLRCTLHPAVLVPARALMRSFGAL